MKGAVFLLILFVLTSCDKEKWYAGTNQLEDGFEDVNVINDLWEDGTGKWSFFQNSSSDNTISIDTSIVFEGAQSLKFTALPTVDGASKSDIANNDLYFQEGQTIVVSAWFYIEGTKNLDYIFLMDIEESIAIGAGPGFRIALQGEEESYIIVERNKMLETTIRQDESTKIEFPRNEWVHLEVVAFLSRKKKGTIQVRQNGTLVIDASNVRNMPKDELFILQGTKGIYNSLQVGITANSAGSNAVLYVDNVKMFIKE